MPRSRVGIFHNEHTRSTPLYPKLKLWCISYILDVFRTISLQHESRCRTSQIGAINSKVRATKACRIFYNDYTRSTPFDSKLIFLCILYCLGALWTIFFPFETRFKTGRTGAINAKVLATKSHQNFSQRTHPIHPIGP